MKNLISTFLLILVSLSLYSQGSIDIKDTRKQAVYVNGIFVSNHNNDANSLEKLLNSLRLSPTDTVEILTHGKITATLTKDFFIIEKDSTAQGPNLDRHFKDSTIKGTLVNRVHEKRVNKFYKVLFYTKDSINNETSVIKVQTQDTTALDCDTCKFMPTETYINLRTHYEGPYVKYQEFEEFDNGFSVEYNLVRSQDSTSLNIQSYANDFWDLFHREGFTKEELYKNKFIFLSGNSGNGIGDPGTEGYSGAILRRHTHESKNKYCQRMAVQKNTGFVKILEPDYNINFR